MKAVIFDMDGVLFDTERLTTKAWDSVGEEIGIGKAGYMVMKNLGRTTEESVKLFRAEFGDRFDNDRFQKGYNNYLESYFKDNGVPVKKGVYSLLECLKSKGYKIAIASSSSRNSVLHHTDNTGITKYFDAIICGDMVEKSKPEPDIYITASRALGVEPSECYAIEDSRAGLWSASKAGCKVVYVPDLYVADDETKKIIDLTFTDLTEFEDVI